MSRHLEQISAKTEVGKHAVVIMDGAGWHQTLLAEDLGNVSIIKLPPYSPELNPIEQVWSWLRQHHLANRCFSGYDDIVESCSRAWNDFIDDTKRVVSMCSRDWIPVGKINTDWYKRALWLEKPNDLLARSAVIILNKTRLSGDRSIPPISLIGRLVP